MATFKIKVGEPKYAQTMMYSTKRIVCLNLDTGVMSYDIGPGVDAYQLDTENFQIALDAWSLADG